MPDEYISREAAIEEIDKWLDTVGTALVGKGMSYYGELIGCIEDARAADVAQVRHGRWEWDTEDIYRCSNCAEKSHVKEVMGHPEWDYCPNCGAKMDGVVGSVAD